MQKEVSTFSLTKETYYSPEANWRYMSVSQYKDFLSCEARAMAKLRGEYIEPTTKALLIGSYVDSFFEGTQARFKEEHPEIFTSRTGELKTDYQTANQIIERMTNDPVFSHYMAGEKQVIKTGTLFGCEWKIKMDSYFPGSCIVDLKVMRSLERIMGISFVEYWKYDMQLAVYSEIEGTGLETYIAVATKQTPADIEVIHVPKWRRQECLKQVEANLPRILAVKRGEVEPERCGVCPYCRATKRLEKPIDFELVGFSTKEIKAMKGEFA